MCRPVSIAEWSEASTAFGRSNVEIVGSNPARSMDVCLFLCVVLSCVGRGLASGRSPVQGVLPIVYRFTSKNPSTPQDKKGRLRRKERNTCAGVGTCRILIRSFIFTLISLNQCMQNACHLKNEFTVRRTCVFVFLCNTVTAVLNRL
jgi:hypothetical protein